MASKIADFVQAIKDEFEPIPLISQDPKMVTKVREAIQYFNSHYYFYTYETLTVSGNILTIGAHVDDVMQVYANETNAALDQNMNDLWNMYLRRYGGPYANNVSLLELIAIRTHWSMIQYLFQPSEGWRFLKHGAPGGQQSLLMLSPNWGAPYCTIKYKFFFDKTDDDFEYTGFPEEWIRKYSIALAKIAEGSILRKSRAVEIEIDGAEMVDDGNKEKEELELQLKERLRPFVMPA